MGPRTVAGCNPGENILYQSVQASVAHNLLDFDLGSHQFPVSTSSDAAQRWFNQGLNWCYCFNHEAGLTCFQKALEYDPQLAMGHWGIAYARGPFYNYTWRDFCEQEVNAATRLCHSHAQAAHALADRCSELEQALIAALVERYQAHFPVTPEIFDTWDDAYAAAMRAVHARFPDHHDVIALFAESLIIRTPWRLWDVKSGHAADGADTLEALSVIEHSIALNEQHGNRQHPAVLHLHIHLTEMSNEPERARCSADRLADLCPDAGHMNHMPGHVYVLIGDYLAARVASEKAIVADRKYLALAGPYNFYTTARAHDLHLMMYTCMLMGQYQPALTAADEMLATLDPSVLGIPDRHQMAVTMEGYYSMKMHVLVRFGRWQDIVEQPLPADPTLYCVSMAMAHYARAIAFATLGQLAEADNEASRFFSALEVIPASRKFFNNSALDTLGVAEMMMRGEVAYHKGQHAQAYEHLREAVRRDDALAYSEPWPWMHPPRHALAALLAEQGHYTEAEHHYRTDLGLDGTVELQRCAQHPNNVWALHGLVECLQHRGEEQELPAVKQALDAALKLTDTHINSSCLCRKHTSCCPKTS